MTVNGMMHSRPQSRLALLTVLSLRRLRGPSGSGDENGNDDVQWNDDGKPLGRARALLRLAAKVNPRDDLEMRTRTTNSVVRAVPKIFHYEARTIAHVDVILISS